MSIQAERSIQAGLSWQKIVSRHPDIFAGIHFLRDCSCCSMWNWHSMFFLIILSRMRPLVKPSCGKWPYIDPLVMNFSPEIWLWHCFYNAYFTFPWKMRFPFWAIWALFSKDFVVPAENMYSCITRRAVFLCHKKTWPGAKAGPGPRARLCEYKLILIDLRCSFLACDYWLCCQDTTLCQDRNSGCIRASGQKSLSWSR